jgi:hypothetical protein
MEGNAYQEVFMFCQLKHMLVPAKGFHLESNLRIIHLWFWPGILGLDPEMIAFKGIQSSF